MTTFVVLIVVRKIALDLPLQRSGHTAVIWMAIVIAGSLVLPKVGSAGFNNTIKTNIILSVEKNKKNWNT